MDERRMQRRVGWVVLFTTTFLGVLLVINNPATSPLHRGGYDMYIDLDRAPGVTENTPVRKDGVLVGRVKAVDWTDDGVRLTVHINRQDVVLYDTDRAQVVPSSIFGDAVVQFIRQPRRQEDDSANGAGLFPNEANRSVAVTPAVMQQQPPVPPPPLPPERRPLLAGSVIEGEALDDPLTAIMKLNQNLSPSIEKLGEAAEQVTILADKINQALGEDIGRGRVQAVLDELVVTLRDFRRTTNNFDQLIADEELREKIAEAFREFPQLMSDARGTLQKAGQTLEGLDSVVASADRNLQNIEGLTEPLGERGEEIADLLISAVENLDIVLGDFSRFARSLNESEGTIGRLIRDRQLSDDIELLIKNANVVVYNINERVRKDLQPILDNVQVFTDKIAREPGRIIGGAVNPSIVK